MHEGFEARKFFRQAILVHHGFDFIPFGGSFAPPKVVSQFGEISLSKIKQLAVLDK